LESLTASKGENVSRGDKLRIPSDSEEWGERREDHWRVVLAQNVREVLGDDAAEELVPDFDPEREYTEKDNIEWTREAMKRMDREVEDEERIEVLTMCAHKIPDEHLEDLKDFWENTRDIDQLHDHWRQRFLRNLERWYGDIPEDWFRFIVDNDWGEAGRKEDNVIIATKIPTRLREFFESDDPKERRYHYCHCPRIRSVVLDDGEGISATYCYCGGGFYKSNWERVIGRAVEVELVESVLKGDDVCKFRITLPSDL
jgi:hypothetical protein